MEAKDTQLSEELTAMDSKITNLTSYVRFSHQPIHVNPVLKIRFFISGGFQASKASRSMQFIQGSEQSKKKIHS